MTSPDFMELKHLLLDQLSAGHAEEELAL